jgi:cellulose synthase/poly-beta-1,6-N-acetylglucosamine synthase-like glycosyltransferase
MVSPGWRRWRGRVSLVGYGLAFLAAWGLVGFDRTLGLIAGALNVILLAFFFRHLAFAIAAARWAEADLDAADVGLDGYEPTVAVLVGCKDEELVIDGLVTALLGLEYPHDRLTLVVVDDGSTDGTGPRLDAWAAASPRLTVLHREVGTGKSDALNAALSLVDAELVVIFDADHEPAPNVLRRLVRHFRDPQVGAVMGRCVVRNGVDSSFASTVFVDYLSGYLVNEYGRQAVFELPAYGGANCAVRADVLRALDGWNPATVTEDTDLTLRVLLAGRRVRYDPTAVDFEEAVVSMRRFWRQRYRWARGHQDVLRDYWREVLRSRHLSVAEKIETMMFLWVYHIPVLCGLGLVLTIARGFGVGGEAAIGLLPLSALLFAGPFAELAVGLLLGRVERRAAWLLVGFLPAFALTILTATKAYLDGMLGRHYTWAKTARTGKVAAAAPPQEIAAALELTGPREIAA